MKKINIYIMYKAWLFKVYGYRSPPPLDSEANLEKSKKKYSNIILPYLDFPNYVRYVSTFRIVCMYVYLFSDVPYYIRDVSTYQDVYESVCLCTLLVIASD